MQGRLPWAPRALAAALVVAAGCTRAPPPAPPESAPPPAIEVSAARTDLVFSYPQDGGRRFATATRVEDVPVEARRQVVVTDLSLSPEVRQAGKYVYLADLTAPRDDGTFPVGLASRYGFEVSATGHHLRRRPPRGPAGHRLQRELVRRV